MQPIEGPAVLWSGARWSGGLCTFMEKVGTHQLRLLRKSKDQVEWPLECKSKACIVLSWVPQPKRMRAVGELPVVILSRPRRILHRGTWRQMMDEWDRLIHTLDLDGDEERVYQHIAEME